MHVWRGTGKDQLCIMTYGQLVPLGPHLFPPLSVTHISLSVHILNSSLKNRYLRYGNSRVESTGCHKHIFTKENFGQRELLRLMWHSYIVYNCDFVDSNHTSFQISLTWMYEKNINIYCKTIQGIFIYFRYFRGPLSVNQAKNTFNHKGGPRGSTFSKLALNLLL